MSSERDTDLSVLSRRGALSEAEERRLRDLLQSSDEARWLHDAGLGFDAEARVVPGDEARIERMARRVQDARRPVRRVLRGRAARGALALVLAAGVAAAGVAAERLTWTGDSDRAAPRAPKALPAAPVPSTRQKAGERRQAVPAAAHGTDEAPPALVAPAPRSSHVERERGDARVPDRAPPTVELDGPAPPGAVPVPTARFDAAPPTAATADTLFAEANRERMRGNTAGAISLYERLRAEFPRSAEAAACNVTLGVLYLQLGQPDRALGAFRRAPASAEALWGQAQALQQLGRAREERAVLQDIVDRHPGSAYATVAQKRLAELN